MASAWRISIVKRLFRRPTANEDGFQYEPLRNRYMIRLLSLEPELTDDGHFACSISTFSRVHRNIPAYQALSYCWGDPKLTRHVYLGGKLCGIHENLWRLLNLLWESSMFDYFWTDCLSLNQRDGVEICAQLPVMGQIYSKAERVLLCLGYDTQGQDALEHLSDWQPPNAPGKDTIEAYRLITSVAYWNRVWVIQEVASARKGTVIAGKSSMDLEQFLDKAIWVHHNAGLPHTIPSILGIHTMRTQGKKTLLELLCGFQHCQSTKPIDRVYGLLGLVSDSWSWINQLDVQRDKTPRDVFWDVIFEGGSPWPQYESLFCALEPMYKAEHPQVWVDSLNEYIQDPKTPGTRRQQSRTTLEILAAIRTLMLSYDCFDDSNQQLPWRRALQAVISSIWDPALQFRRSSTAFALALFLAGLAPVGKLFQDMTPEHSVAWKACNVDMISISPSWSHRKSFLLRPILNDGQLSPIKSYFMPDSQDPSTAIMFNFIGGFLFVKSFSGSDKFLYTSLSPMLR
ncbi:heterokaryon incompatibility protein-domain-containing protein [Hypoxylon sp. FL1150]|nr:heterokaryon incompatibility protein-domain-containing protein [Hypoxylon sp. FL1150]